MDSHSTTIHFITNVTARFAHIVVTGLAIAGWIALAGAVSGWLDLSWVVAGR